MWQQRSQKLRMSLGTGEAMVKVVPNARSRRKKRGGDGGGGEGDGGSLCRQTAA